MLLHVSGVRHCLASSLAVLCAVSAAAFGPGARLPDGRISVIVELSEPAAAEVWLQRLGSAGPAVAAMQPEAMTRATAAARAQLALADSEQQAFVEALAGSAVRAAVVFRVQRLLNGVALEVDEADLARLEQWPGVKGVHPNPLLEPANATSVPWIGAPRAWQDLGVTGKDVRVGVIDSGIDYLHRDFGGSGSYAGHNFDDNVVPWNAKVVGGIDMCGDGYTGSSSTLQPDGDPMDCAENGHGTHVAGSLAGYGVTADGQTYSGPWRGGLDPASFRIGPGVAPEAKLYAIRVFGCSGNTGLVLQALDWAADPNGDGNFADRLDVVNLSLGSKYGSASSAYRTSIDRLVALGTVVVAAAGNDGDLYTIVGAPSSVDSALSVASCVDDGVTGARLRVETPQALAGEVPSTSAQFGPAPPLQGVSGAVVASAPLDACGPLSNPAEVAGRIALIDRGSCNFTVKVKNAQLAGAVAAIVANNTGGPLIVMAGDDASITIPSVFISQADGVTLRGGLAGGVTASIRMASLAGTVATSSSRGPRGGDFALKPEIAAPGVSITSAGVRSGSQGATFSGTSMATPHVAGVVALLRQRHPDWSATEIKAAVMGRARRVLTVPAEEPGPLHGAGRVGSGLVDPAAAAAAELLAGDADAPARVAMSFGLVEATGVTRVRRTARVVNKGGSARSVVVGFEPMVAVPGVEVAFPDGDTITVPSGGSVTFPVELVVDATAVRAARDPGAASTQDGQPRHYPIEHSGHVTLTGEAGEAVSLPLHAVIRPSSALALDVAPSGLVVGRNTTIVELPFRGQALGEPGGEATATTALVTPLELAWAHTGAEPGSNRHGAIRWLGLGSDAPARGGMAGATVLFGIAVYGPWATPRDVSVTITVDAGADGSTDARIMTRDYGTFVSTGKETPWSSDVYGAVVCPPAGSQCGSFTFLDRVAPGTGGLTPFGTDVMLLAVPAAALGLSDATSLMRVQVHVVAEGTGRYSDTSEVTFDVARPGFSPVSGLPPFALGAGQPLPVRVDRQAFEGRGSRGLLLLHHTNVAGTRAEVVPVAFADCSLASCPEVTASVDGPTRTVTLTAAPPTACTAVQYAWSFGDGATSSSGPGMTHAYERPGTYTWSLAVSAEGQSCTRSGTVTIPSAARRRLGRL
ncbi:MAG TPA: S8 family serine peptidase [Thermoanaerobaculaceae bacterium]|mgnify:CR=1 FL=1|nr:S8 family serine peptidase [Thermoanaerobaculaceae bacterium]HRS15977.1 S8 family serine peptidase [Thermoanaerobaculaceae bacterium]